MKTQHTEWHAQPTDGHETHGQSAVYDANGKDIAIVYDGAAHAALIAAAPGLLEACKSAIVALESAKIDTSVSFEFASLVGKAKGKLRQAINKALIV